MQTKVSILHHDYPARVRDQVEQKLQHLAKFYEHIVSMRALLEKQHSDHRVEIVTAVGWVWPLEVLALLLPVGMASVWVGTVDDGWNGTLGWFWVACAITTIVLVFVTKAALRERYYSAVMAATGLLYLAILTAFGTDLVARAVLAS